MRFDWNSFPETKEFVDSSGITSVAETEDFRSMYTEACRIYKLEGGDNELGKQNVKVFPIYASSDE
jgi:hypothetical protein